MPSLSLSPFSPLTHLLDGKRNDQFEGILKGMMKFNLFEKKKQNRGTEMG